MARGDGGRTRDPKLLAPDRRQAAANNEEQAFTAAKCPADLDQSASLDWLGGAGWV
jgi:hypothetical protein